VNQVQRNLSLVIPDLLSVAANCAAVPELESTLARASRRRERDQGLEAVLFKLFDVPPAADGDLPVAAVGYVSDAGKKPPGYCLRADPVQLVPDRDQLIMLGNAGLNLSQAEAERLVTELNQVFQEDGWRWEAPTPLRWYLHLPQAAALHTYPLAMVWGKAIGEYLPGGAEGRQWHRVLNEVQMVLHASEVNRQRETLAQATVSSVWFWGGGELPELGHSRWSHVWSDEPVSLGLAQLSYTPRDALPATGAAWLQAATAPGEHLLVLDGLDSALRQQGVDPDQAFYQWYQAWLAPLFAALAARRFNSLILHTCHGTAFHLTPLGLKRWWRRRVSVKAYL
jgi:hypothetical protein